MLTAGPIALRPLRVSDASDDYLSWLNDPEVNRYSRRAGRTETMDGLRSWLEHPSPDLRFAILLDGRHVGGISLASISEGSAELNIMVGARDIWGRGVGRQAIALLTRHGLDDLGLSRIWAESPNPAFNAAMRRLGWTLEGSRPSPLGELACWAVDQASFVHSRTTVPASAAAASPLAAQPSATLK